jgi:hypothetical protein
MPHIQARKEKKADQLIGQPSRAYDNKCATPVGRLGSLPRQALVTND